MTAERRNLIVKMREIADALESGKISGACLAYMTPEGGVQYIYQHDDLATIAIMLLGLRRVPSLIEERLMANDTEIRCTGRCAGEGCDLPCDGHQHTCRGCTQVIGRGGGITSTRAVTGRGGVQT